MPARPVPVAVAEGVPVSLLRRRPVLCAVQRSLPVQQLPAPDLAHEWHPLRWYQAAAHRLVSGDLPAHSEQEHYVGPGIEAPDGGLLQHRLASKAQDPPGDEGTG